MKLLENFNNKIDINFSLGTPSDIVKLDFMKEN